MVREMQLEAGHTGQRPGRRADLGGEVGQRREVVAEGGRLRSEAVTGELHTVTGVTGEPDDHPVEATDFFLAGRFALLTDDGFVGMLGWATDLTGH